MQFKLHKDTGRKVGKHGVLSLTLVHYFSLPKVMPLFWANLALQYKIKSSVCVVLGEAKSNKKGKKIDPLYSTA